MLFYCACPCLKKIIWSELISRNIQTFVRYGYLFIYFFIFFLISKIHKERFFFCQVLATGLSGLYSLLPRKLDVETEDWHRLTPDDINELSELTLFINSFEFCNAVAQVWLVGALRETPMLMVFLKINFSGCSSLSSRPIVGIYLPRVSSTSDGTGTSSGNFHFL